MECDVQQKWRVLIYIIRGCIRNIRTHGVPHPANVLLISMHVFTRHYAPSDLMTMSPHHFKRAMSTIFIIVFPYYSRFIPPLHFLSNLVIMVSSNSLYRRKLVNSISFTKISAFPAFYYKYIYKGIIILNLYQIPCLIRSNIMDLRGITSSVTTVTCMWTVGDREGPHMLMIINVRFFVL